MAISDDYEKRFLKEMNRQQQNSLAGLAGLQNSLGGQQLAQAAQLKSGPPSSPKPDKILLLLTD